MKRMSLQEWKEKCKSVEDGYRNRKECQECTEHHKHCGHSYNSGCMDCTYPGSLYPDIPQYGNQKGEKIYPFGCGSIAVGKTWMGTYCCICGLNIRSSRKKMGLCYLSCTFCTTDSFHEECYNEFRKSEKSLEDLRVEPRQNLTDYIVLRKDGEHLKRKQSEHKEHFLRRMENEHTD